MYDRKAIKTEALRKDIQRLREEWRKIRAAKLKRKTELQTSKYDKNKIRRDKVYKSLRKKQHRISVRIKHIEKKLNRMQSGTVLSEEK